MANQLLCGGFAIASYCLGDNGWETSGLRDRWQPLVTAGKRAGPANCQALQHVTAGPVAPGYEPYSPIARRYRARAIGLRSPAVSQPGVLHWELFSQSNIGKDGKDEIVACGIERREEGGKALPLNCLIRNTRDFHAMARKSANHAIIH
ncbi:hypothetical protein OE88DRAFT_1649442 [Heliocybe sulcata]|uniref:Uncharacterized protein n=1 Tax=Heliocybe sulcata TaxID=5364 RepID=A0A5C3MJ75_9AGAM|nr:hypothetical protein OE88DRAFT_1649442 [Heliocybe sulcata]